MNAFADVNSNVEVMINPLLDKVENMVGKGENAVYQHFLLFPPVFSKALFFRVSKTQDFEPER